MRSRPLPVTLFAPLFVVACGGAASETPPPAATASTPTAVASNRPPAASSDPASAASANAAPLPSAVVAIADPAAPDDPSRVLHVEAPGGATTQVSGTTVNVLAGPRFGMAVTEQGGLDLHETAKSYETPRSAVQNAHVEKINDEVLVYTGTDLGRDGYHFIALVETANPKHAYACSDSGLLKVELTRADVDAMIRACRSLKH